MEKDVISAIEKNYSGFSKSQRRIAEYLTGNFDKAAFMTAAKLGKTVGVSESTVVRFASELGYDGYPGMRKALQEMIRTRSTSVQRIKVTKDVMGSKDVLDAVLHWDMEKLRDTLEETSREAFHAAVKAIAGARRIYILGTRSSKALSVFMGFYLNLLFDDVRVVDDTSISEIFEQMLRLTNEDVVIGISFPRYSSRTVRALRFARDRNATVIGITDNEDSPIAKVSEIKLLAKSDMVSFVDSLVAPLSLINALIVALGAETGDRLSGTFSELENLWAEYGVYEKGDK
ncbi:MAG TPA: MurR/RpiR family transcriptional regulator [Clostridiales bacterium]|jgi:DNA-binding MurR/RpiR family transcriptional regulator|nr:MurR/RpiR family transcriptional regulator [Clostridiales bacterium]